EEKAQVNEALGFELTGETERAHSLARTLREKFPHSGAAAALWVRTAPYEVRSVELEAAVAGFVDKEIDVALALAIGSLNREDLERAEQYARVATHLGPDVPQSWLMLGQALHVRGFREVRVGDRMDLLQAARTHYSKVIELASKQGSVHI